MDRDCANHSPLAPLLSPLLLAFGWTSPLMLGWLAVAAAPILIHLWSRRKYREMSFAAMEYLLAAVRRQTRWLLFEQWLLLALRTLVVVLVVLAVAEPYAHQAGFAFPPGGHTHRVLVFDGSYSMACKPADQTRFDHAKQLARQIVKSSPAGDAFTLLVMSTSPRVVIGHAALEHSAVLEEIDGLELPQTIAKLPPAIAATQQLIESVGRENPRLVRHDVYFLSDMQRLTWAPLLSKSAAAKFRRQLEELAQRAALVLMDLGQPQVENLMISDLRVTDPLATVGRDVPLEVDLKIKPRPSVAPSGATTGRGLIPARPSVELLVDSRRVAEKKVDFTSDGSATTAFTYRFDAPGDHSVEARVTGDALEVDNHRYLVLPVCQAIRVLCIDGRPSAKPFQGAADYLAVALASQGTKGTGSMQTDVAGENALLERNLTDYNCLFLCNVAQFTASEASALEGYLQAGGSVVFFLGDQVLADRYNRELGVVARDEKGKESGILPARLGAVVDRPPGGLDPMAYRHPIVQAFRGRGEASLLGTPIFKYIKLSPPNESSARNVLAMANGDPLIVEQPVQRGRVVLVATAADATWTALPLWPSFVPLVNEIVAWCAASQIDERNVTVGQPLKFSWTGRRGAAPPSVQSPDGRGRPVAPRKDDGDAVLSYADTSQSGIYTLRFAPPASGNQLFAVNVDPAEGDLARVEPDELRTGPWQGIPFVHQTSWQDSGAAAPTASASGGSRLHVHLLYAVLGLLFLETFVGWRLSKEER